MCLGVYLARREMAIFFEVLLPRLEPLELAGAPRRTLTNFVGGPKSLPIRFRMRTQVERLGRYFASGSGRSCTFPT